MNKYKKERKKIEI